MNIKKYYPFIFPTIALLIVLFLAFRWYNLRTKRDQDTAQEQIQIENLTDQEMSEVVNGAPDIATVNLQGESTASGQVRYRVREDKVLFSVNASLEELTAGDYQVWIQVGDEKPQSAFVLEYGKGGYMGSASVSSELLPFDIIVSQEENTADQMLETEIMRGTVTAEQE